MTDYSVFNENELAKIIFNNLNTKIALQNEIEKKDRRRDALTKEIQYDKGEVDKIDQSMVDMEKYLKKQQEAKQ